MIDTPQITRAICVPVRAPVDAVRRVSPGEAAKVARTVYHGSYRDLCAAWGEFKAWIAANGHDPRPNLYECYVAGPESNPNRPIGEPNSTSR